MRERRSCLRGRRSLRASATLEQTFADATALDRGEARLAVAYMRGETKTKGATRPVYELLRLLAR